MTASYRDRNVDRLNFDLGKRDVAAAEEYNVVKPIPRNLVCKTTTPNTGGARSKILFML